MAGDDRPDNPSLAVRHSRRNCLDTLKLGGARVEQNQPAFRTTDNAARGRRKRVMQSATLA